MEQKNNNMPYQVNASFHALVLKGQGFVFRVGENLYRTYKGNEAPEDADIIVDNSFARIKKKVLGIAKYGSINGQYADLMTWMERGLYITCINANMTEDKEKGIFNIVTGQPIDY